MQHRKMFVCALSITGGGTLFVMLLQAKNIYELQGRLLRMPKLNYPGPIIFIVPRSSSPGKEKVYPSKFNYKVFWIRCLSEIASSNAGQWLNNRLSASVPVVFLGEGWKCLASTRIFLVLAASHIENIAQHILEDELEVFDGRWQIALACQPFFGAFQEIQVVAARISDLLLGRGLGSTMQVNEEVLYAGSDFRTSPVDTLSTVQIFLLSRGRFVAQDVVLI